jgi:NADH-quinone oxidoreductase subunit I
MAVLGTVAAFWRGFATTLKHLFRKPITVNYPDQKFPMFPKYRGKQVLMRDENGQGRPSLRRRLSDP